MSYCLCNRHLPPCRVCWANQRSSEVWSRARASMMEDEWGAAQMGRSTDGWLLAAWLPLMSYIGCSLRYTPTAQSRPLQTLTNSAVIGQIPKARFGLRTQTHPEVQSCSLMQLLHLQDLSRSKWKRCCTGKTVKVKKLAILHSRILKKIMRFKRLIYGIINF